MSRSFDIKLDKISEFYQTFNICAMHFKMIADNCFNNVVKVVHYMKRSLLNNGLNLFRNFKMLRTHSGCKQIIFM